ncbi:MAG: dipeptide ABC transporter ATP-binding protein [Lawsonibacter sp.]|nr:dipeptide ABC transporter ATP-binding protein [Lawsonibacter sp.]
MSETGTREVLMDIRGVKKWFPVKRGLFGRDRRFVKAVDDINLTIRKGDTLGLVGESGCGKSTLARSILRLIEPTEGEVIFRGEDLVRMSPGQLRSVRRDIQIIFQDPYASLNPRMKVRDILAEPFLIHGLCDRQTARKKASELVDMVGLNQDSLGKYPHEFSGGQRQRICIARALAVEPKLVVCDECVSALDVSIQAQIINLLMELQRKLDLTLIFISHDLRVVRHISSHVAVLYLGKIVEYAPKTELFSAPKHPYTQALLSAMPIADPDADRRRIRLEGDLPSPIDQPSGCSFHTRCPMAQESCAADGPALLEISPGHLCRCPYAAAGKGEGDGL